jgi:sugar lactone lactonase YvrE
MVDVKKVVWALVGMVATGGGCSSTPAPVGSDGEGAAPQVLDAGTIADTSVAPPPFDAAANPGDDPAAAAGDERGFAGDASASTVDATDGGDIDAAPLPPTLPLAQVMAAKPEFLGLVPGGRGEGVAWRNGELFFSLVSQSYYRLKADGHIYRYLALKPNGSFVLADGSILVCDDTYTVVQVFPDTGKVGIIGGNGGVCNDICVDAWGNIYFSDFIDAVYRITPDGVQTRAVTGLRAPNGIAVDRESKYLYMLPRPSDIFRVAIDATGPVGTPQKVGQLAAITDGCNFDAWGNLWASVFGTGEIAIFDPTQLKVIASIGAGAYGITMLTFGGPNRDAIFVTTESHGLFKIPVGARGADRFPGASKYALKGYVNITPLDQLVK